MERLFIKSLQLLSYYLIIIIRRIRNKNYSFKQLIPPFLCIFVIRIAEMIMTKWGQVKVRRRKVFNLNISYIVDTVEYKDYPDFWWHHF
ncbi:MAG: hypothetical protein LUH22_01370 [Bacteroides sp.]|nr:hypothetical protein [Bacteroides sp.]